MRGSLLDSIASNVALAAGFQRVRGNAGCAGVDGESIHQFSRRLRENLDALSEEIRTRTYRPIPLLRVLVPRKDGEARQLCIPAVRDRIAQAAALEVLAPVLEAEFEDCSFGYRAGRSVGDVVRRIRRLFEAGYRWVFEADVDAYFDNVDHALLIGRLESLLPDRRVVKLLSHWIRAWVWDGSQIYRLKRGIPQGSVVSPVLANLVLDQLDEKLLGAGLQMLRYADDFVVLCKDRPGAESAAKLTDEVLDSLRLSLDDAAIKSFDDGFSFLGVTFMRSLAVQRLPSRKRAKRVLFMPPPMTPDQLKRWGRSAFPGKESWRAFT